MQNAELKFIAFDAQDVLTTSDGGGGPYFLGSLQDISCEEFNSREGYFTFDTSGTPWYYLDKNLSIVSEFPNSTYYTLNSAEYYFDIGGDISYVINATGTNDKPKGEALDLGGVLQWLKDNATLQQ